MKLQHWAIVAAPLVIAVCSEIQDKVPPKYSIFVVALMAAAYYFMRPPAKTPPKDGAP